MTIKPPGEKSKVCGLLYKTESSYNLPFTRKIGFYIKRCKTMEKE